MREALQRLHPCSEGTSDPGCTGIIYKAAGGKGRGGDDPMTIDPKNPSLIYVDADGEAHNLLPLDADGPTEWKHRAQKIKLPPLDPHKMYTPSEVASLLNRSEEHTSELQSLRHLV